MLSDSTSQGTSQEGWEIKEILPTQQPPQLLSCPSRGAESCRCMKCQISLSLSALERLLDPPNRGQLPGWKRKSSNSFPTTLPQAPRLSWNRAGLHPGKNIGGKPRGIGSFCFSEIAFPSNICSHTWSQAGLWAVLRGSSFSCSLHGAGAALRGCSGTRRGARGFLHSVPAHTPRIYRISNRSSSTTATGIYPPRQREFIHHSNRNLSITPK